MKPVQPINCRPITRPRTIRHPLHRIFVTATFIITVHSLSLPTSVSSRPKYENHRHVCLIDKYDNIRGPHFAALFDEIWGQSEYDTKRVAYITCGEPGEEKNEERKVQQITEDLGLQTCQIINLTPATTTRREICDPEALRIQIQLLQPSILWLAPHDNAYVLRHAMRVHNLDQLVQELCGPCTGPACLFVGEGAGALCAGANMAVAGLRGDNSKASPELQFRGLNLVGPRKSFSFTKPETYDPQQLQNARERLSRMPLYNVEKDVTLFLNPQQVYLYSQVSSSTNGPTTTSLIMNPYQKGAIEQLQTSELSPVPPLSFADAVDHEGSSIVTRVCTGEPSEDPSRIVQLYNPDDDKYW